MSDHMLTLITQVQAYRSWIARTLACFLWLQQPNRDRENP